VKKKSTSSSLVPVAGDPASRFATAILNALSEVPDSTQKKARKPEEAAKTCANAAAAKAAVTAGTLALPPGPAGWLTILPELMAVWRIQAQMVADIAAIYGKKATVTREQMLWCLFKHTASQAVRDLVVRMGTRWLVKIATLRTLQGVAQRLGVKVTQRAFSKSVTRWLPLVGPLGVGAYAYYDTAQVAKSAIELFSAEIDIEAETTDV
jgi:uncharacterized protein (DUF697 family)